MSDEVQEPGVAAVAAEEAQPVEPEPAPLTPAAEPDAATEETKKSVKFEQNELTFDEAQAEIDAIKARAGQARESLKSVPTTTPTSSYGSYSSSNTASGYSYEDDVPKSKNMLSHLNSHSAMINYKVQAARSLVRKQEDLLRNLARMRENMERSENEIGKASDYYSPTRHQPRGYFERRAESAPLISRRQQVREVRELSPAVSANHHVDFQNTADISDHTSVTTTPYISSHISAIPSSVAISTNDYQPDADFEREMAAIRKRVADLSKQANEFKAPKYSSYDYDSSLASTYLPGGYSDIYSTQEPRLKQSMPEAEVQ